MAGVITHFVNDITPATFMECRIPWRCSSVDLDGRSDQGIEPVRVCFSILDLAGLVLEPDKTVERKCAGHLELVNQLVRIAKLKHFFQTMTAVHS